MKYLVIGGLIILAAVIYINRSYAYFYNFQGSHFIGNPSYSSPHHFNNNRQKEVSKIVVLGDSLSAGTGSTSEEKSLGYLIANELSKEKNISLINLAYPGVGVKDVLERQLPKAIEENPEYVVLMIGTNDVHNQMTDRQFRDYYQQILEQLKNKTTAKITIINIPYIGSDKILLPPWNIILSGRIKEFNRIIFELAFEKQIKVIDLYSQFEKQFRHSTDLYSNDQFHPSDKGYALWADYINENLNR